MEVARHAEGDEGRLADFVQIARDTLRRRWLTLATVTVLVFGLAIVAILTLPQRFTSSTLVRIDPSRSPLAGQPQQAQQELNPESLETEVAILSSHNLAKETARKLNLVKNPQFTSDPEFAGLNEDEKLNAVASGLLKNLSVSRDKLTYIISISYTAKDPNQAAEIANGVADAYIEHKIGSNVGTAERQSEWYSKQMAELDLQVREADARVAQYRAEAGLVPGGNGTTAVTTIADQQVAPLSSALATAESEAAAARASLAIAQRQIAQGGLDSVAEVRNSQVINDLRRQRAEILRSMGEVEARYGAKHPEMIRVKEQLSSIDQQIREEANRAIGSLRATAVAADARASSLRGSLDRLKTEQSANTKAAALADGLEREAASKRAAYNKLSQMSLESAQAASNQISQAVIVERATPPKEPSFPNKKLLLVLGLIVGVAAGIATIIVQEMLVQGMRTVDEVEDTLGLPVLAVIPKLQSSGSPADYMLEKPASLFAESLRIARTAILAGKQRKAFKVIAITSALPSEGKSTTALAFARTLALNNARTLLIDCDLRRAQLRFISQRQAHPTGIVELLKGEAELTDAIHPGDVDGLDQIVVTKPYFSSEDMFGADSVMERVLEQLRPLYDQIVLDLPPLVGLADGRYLAVLADATVLALRWGATPPQAAIMSVSWLRADGANPVGVIYTMVDSAAEAIGGLYYSKKYSDYYQQT